MGGSIAVTVRKTSGQIVRMCRHTNALPYFFQDVRWIDADERHLEDYLRNWDVVREDWERHGGDGQTIPDFDDFPAYEEWSDKFSHSWTSVYARYPFLAPHGYGLVVIDYTTKTVLTMQGYSALIDLFAGDLTSKCTLAEDERDRLRALFERGCVYASDSGGRRSVDMDTARKLADAGWSTSWRELRFYVDPTPWTLHRFPESAQGLSDLRAHVVGLSLPLTDHEMTLWAAYEAEAFGDD